MTHTKISKTKCNMLTVSYIPPRFLIHSTIPLHSAKATRHSLLSTPKSFKKQQTLIMFDCSVCPSISMF